MGHELGARSAYLDHASSTSVFPEVLEVMAPWLSFTANPSGAHRLARQARQAIEEARDQLSAVLGCQSRELVFTSGGTESNNLAISGVIARRGGRPICSAVEHHSVLDVVSQHGGSVAPVSGVGEFDTDQFKADIDRYSDASLLSVMTTNNEVGTIQPVLRAAGVAKRKIDGITVHSDAVNAFMWTDLKPVVEVIDLLSVSAHKVGGPKGVGALFVREDVQLDAQLVGGGQERERRSGTQNVAGIVGLGFAAQIAASRRAEVCSQVERLRNLFVDELISAVDGVVETVPRNHKTPQNAHLMFADVESESLLVALDEAQISCSVGSSSASGAVERSHVLQAMGVDENLAKGAMRFSLGWSTTEDEIDYTLEVIPPIVKRLRDSQMRDSQVSNTGAQR